MKILTVVAPALKVLFERVGKPEVVNLPDLLRPDGSGAVIVCNHVGWADSLWLAYATYPRPLRFMSKHELFDKPLSKWCLEQGGCIPLNRGEPSVSSIKTAVDLVRLGEVMLIFPSGTRKADNILFKRGAATIALHAQVPIVPAFYDGPGDMHVTHLIGRPRITVTFGRPIVTAGMVVERDVAAALTERLRVSIDHLRSMSAIQTSAA
jgi:1-acyl-sn-glycerol-3-phosphate acyltransferase